MPKHSYSFAMVNARFPHVGQLIQEHWSQPRFNDFMRELLAQDPKRQGFPTGIISALHAVALEHYMERRPGAAATPGQASALCGLAYELLPA